MYKVLLTLILGLSVVLAQLMPRPNCGKMSCDNPEMANQDFNPMTPDEPIMPPDIMCKQNPREMVETIRIYKITEELNLTEDQSMRFFPKLKEMRIVKEEFNQTRIKLTEQLEGYLKDPNKFTKDIKSIITEIETNELKLREKENRIKKEINNILTPEQQAKFMLFQMRFNQEMREMVGKAKGFRKNIQDKEHPKRWRLY